MIQKTKDLQTTLTSFQEQETVCCIACGSTHVTDIFESKQLPVNVGVMGNTAEEALNAPTADIILTYCSSCGLVFNRIFDHSIVEFQPGYEVALQHSTIFREFTNSVIERLVTDFDLHNKNILELGCGAGYFLRSICELGTNQGIGIDPTVPEEGHHVLKQGSVEFIRDFYSSKYQHLQSDFVCCLSVFEDIPAPAQFLTDVREMIGTRTDVPLYFEVFNAFRAIQQRETWSIHYEQCNYFSLESMTAMFKKCGFKITNSGTCYQDGQYLYIEALPDQQSPSDTSKAPSPELPTEIASFASHHLEKLDYWTQLLNESRSKQERVLIWGTGGKGISFLNSLNTQGLIEYAVEINPDKHGKFVPGSGQQIVPPEFMTQYQPDKVIITNALYQEEMQQQAKQLGVNPEFLIA
ncbi:MAG: SAM-dependent methyltransferase [Blastopirellula sp.]|nr:MAG: SAM-dependent methyltransferase [Blastopirellula sp.]